MPTKPTGPVQVRMYDVGFGDCFLLSVPYATGARHVLIDFGTTHGAPSAHMLSVAKDIATTCGGKLTAVVATHRHRDHIEGFATRKGGKGPGDVIASLKPDLVIQPWTEHPKAAPDATEPPKDRKALRLEIQSLSARQELAASLVARLKATRTIPRDLDYLAGNNLRNVSAVENLMRMGKKGKAEYVYSGFKTDLSKLLPGVKVHVLGPPTVRQTDTVLKQRQSDQDEFWMLRLKMSRPPSKAVGASLPREKQGSASRVPQHARWFVGQMKSIELAEVRSIVESLDKAMNNTSVILLFEAGSQRLLFPGDAQIENWAYALDPKRGFRKLLEGVTVYKVGHHGSRNATPKTLWNLFKARRSSGGKGLVSLISTMPEVHGSVNNRSEVPRETLVDALRAAGPLHSTEDFRGASLAQTL